jgi:menaquinone-9 beta-reductase
MRNFDVIVAGAGPAGSAAAYLLAGAGMRVALIDKESFPRDKLCGGMLTGRTEKVYKSIFSNGWQDAYEFKSANVRIFYKTRLLNEIRDYRTHYFTTRSAFDHHLVQLASARGATLLERTRATSLEVDRRSVRLADGRVIRGDFIIGADGANSMIARDLGLAAGKNAMAAGLEAEIPRQGKMAGLDRPEIHFGLIRWGYGWVFPKKDTVTIGIAGLAHKNPGFRDLFRAFLAQICPEAPDVPWKGHPVPFCKFTLRPGTGNVLLAGDAAGFVEPLTGEGIAFAMQSGSCAAHAILDAARTGDPRSALNNYQQRYRPTARLLTQAKWMRYLVFPSISEALLVKALRRSESMICRYFDVLADEIDYAVYFRFLVKKLKKHFLW